MFNRLRPTFPGPVEFFITITFLVGSFPCHHIAAGIVFDQAPEARCHCLVFLLFLLGPFIFTVVKFKKRPSITLGVSYDLGSCPLTGIIACHIVLTFNIISIYSLLFSTNIKVIEVNKIKTHLQALYLCGTYYHKTGTRPPLC